MCKKWFIGLVAVLVFLMGNMKASTARSDFSEVRASENRYKVVVDYRQSLRQMIVAGRYYSVNSDINAENFLVQGHGQVEAVVELVHFGREMKTKKILKKLNARGLRPATLPELLAFGAAYPEKQQEYPVVALGYLWRNRYAAYLGYGSAGRKLHLFGDRWGEHYRFAAVRLFE